MFDPGKLAILFAALALSCCKSDHSAPGHVAPQQVTTPEKTAHGPVDAIPSAHAPVGQPEAASGGGSADSPNAAPWPKDLPHLKPVIDKPFPEGATEEQVCEAIDNTAEKDLWVRFGHLVPMYVRGALYVLQTKDGDIKKLTDYIQGPYIYPHHVQVASCRPDRALLYLRSMVNESEFEGKRFGRVHLSEELAKRYSIKTLESFQLEDAQERLSDYCRADADLCEELVKVDPANEGEGLCPSALGLLGIYSENPKYLDLKRLCNTYDRRRISCSWYTAGTTGQEACRAQIRQLLSR